MTGKLAWAGRAPARGGGPGGDSGNEAKKARWGNFSADGKKALFCFFFEIDNGEHAPAVWVGGNFTTVRDPGCRLSGVLEDRAKGRSGRVGRFVVSLLSGGPMAGAGPGVGLRIRWDLGNRRPAQAGKKPVGPGASRANPQKPGWAGVANLWR